MVVRNVLRALVVIVARSSVVSVLGALGFPVEHVERTRHAEMHQQHVAGIKVREQILRPPAEAGDSLALEAGDKILLQWPA